MHSERETSKLSDPVISALSWFEGEGEQKEGEDSDFSRIKGTTRAAVLAIAYVVLTELPAK